MQRATTTRFEPHRNEVHVDRASTVSTVAPYERACRRASMRDAGCKFIKNEQKCRTFVASTFLACLFAAAESFIICCAILALYQIWQPYTSARA